MLSDRPHQANYPYNEIHGYFSVYVACGIRRVPSCRRRNFKRFHQTFQEKLRFADTYLPLIIALSNQVEKRSFAPKNFDVTFLKVTTQSGLPRHELLKNII